MDDALKPKSGKHLKKLKQIEKDSLGPYGENCNNSKQSFKSGVNGNSVDDVLPPLSNETDAGRIVKATETFNDREKLMENLLDKSFIKKHKRGTLKQIQKEKRANLQEGNVIRKQADRERLHGTECSCCMGYYNALDLSPNSKLKRINQVSRHRYVENPMPKTPEHYWEVGFPTESEQRSRGLIKIATPRKIKDSISKKLF